MYALGPFSRKRSHLSLFLGGGGGGGGGGWAAGLGSDIGVWFNHQELMVVNIVYIVRGRWGK